MNPKPYGFSPQPADSPKGRRVETDEEWWRLAYRQGVHPILALKEEPVDDMMQRMLDSMPDVAEGRFFRGPDNRFRRRTFEVAEDRAQTEIRRQASKDMHWDDLRRLGDEEAYPGEEQAIERLRNLQKTGFSIPGAVNDNFENLQLSRLRRGRLAHEVSHDCNAIYRQCLHECIDVFEHSPHLLPGTGSDHSGRIRWCIRECMMRQGCNDF